MVMERMGHLVSACCTSLTFFAAMCPSSGSSLGIVVFFLEILDLEVSSPCTVPVSCLTRAIVAVEQTASVSKKVEIGRFDFITLSHKASRDLLHLGVELSTSTRLC